MANHARRATSVALIASLLAALPGSAGAFGDSGHRVIGQLAELHLRNSRALAEVRKILAPGETLADATVWHDTIKNPLYEDQDSEPFRLEHPAHEVYHYVNLPFQVSRYDPSVPGARSDDLVQMARATIRVLRGGSTTFSAREALRLLAHLAGDVHQPLHVGNGYVTVAEPLVFVEPRGTTGWRVSRGGNSLVYGPQDRFNLHSYWDVHAVNLAMRREDIPTYASRLFKEPIGPDWRNTGDADSWPEQWANESLALAAGVHKGIRILAYLGPDDARRNPHRWRIEQPAGYDDYARARVPVQLAKAGYRLAETLNAIWPQGR